MEAYTRVLGLCPSSILADCLRTCLRTRFRTRHCQSRSGLMQGCTHTDCHSRDYTGKGFERDRGVVPTSDGSVHESQQGILAPVTFTRRRVQPCDCVLADCLMMCPRTRIKDKTSSEPFWSHAGIYAYRMPFSGLNRRGARERPRCSPRWRWKRTRESAGNIGSSHFHKEESAAV